jgi:4-hydroxy-tetrahydrodipicolinate synthase
MMGMNAGELRLPLCDMSDAHMEQMKTVLTRYGLLK